MKRKHPPKYPHVFKEIKRLIRAIGRLARPTPKRLSKTFDTLFPGEHSRFGALPFRRLYVWTRHDVRGQ